MRKIIVVISVLFYLSWPIFGQEYEKEGLFPLPPTYDSNLFIIPGDFLLGDYDDETKAVWYYINPLYNDDFVSYIAEYREWYKQYTPLFDKATQTYNLTIKRPPEWKPEYIEVEEGYRKSDNRKVTLITIYRGFRTREGMISRSWPAYDFLRAVELYANELRYKTKSYHNQKIINETVKIFEENIPKLQEYIDQLTPMFIELSELSKKVAKSKTLDELEVNYNEFIAKKEARNAILIKLHETVLPLLNKGANNLDNIENNSNSQHAFALRDKALAIYTPFSKLAEEHGKTLTEQVTIAYEKKLKKLKK
jgi:hypothetical protein